MKIQKEQFGLMLCFDNECSHFIHTICEWEQLFGKWNWYDFHLFLIRLHNDNEFAPGYEFEFIVLGLGFRARFNKSWENTELQESIDDMEEQLKKRKKNV